MFDLISLFRSWQEVQYSQCEQKKFKTKKKKDKLLNQLNQIETVNNPVKFEGKYTFVKK